MARETKAGERLDHTRDEKRIAQACIGHHDERSKNRMEVGCEEMVRTRLPRPKKKDALTHSHCQNQKHLTQRRDPTSTKQFDYRLQHIRVDAYQLNEVNTHPTE